MNTKIEQLIRKGVRIPNPASIEIGDEVDIDRISGNGVVIHAGCKIFGKSALILQGVKLGYESPVTVEDCQIGPDVELKGGFFRQAVFLTKASVGYGAHVREGCILEEEASAAHTVGLKQTILFPFVTLGSLINFCDCLMSGGTSRQDHSEVGSSYIHFNYTPNQDKATASLIGDVPRGVMLNQRPIFLGGQGGLVGPCRLEFGTVIAAGSIYRKDELKPGRLLFEGGVKSGSMPFTTGVWLNIKRIINNNILYIANLIALRTWYRHVRWQFISEKFPPPLYEGLMQRLQQGIDERMKRLRELAEKMPGSVESYNKYLQGSGDNLLIRQKRQLAEQWSRVETFFRSAADHDGNPVWRDEFLEAIQEGMKTFGKEYLPVIKGLNPRLAETGTRWLQELINWLTNEVHTYLTLF